MTQAQQDPNTLSSADWGTLDDLINRYETAWRRGERPALAQGLPQAGALRRAALRELIHAELEIRLKAGEGARVEDYLQRFPEVATPEEVVALLVREYDCRRRLEPQLGLQEYQRRFPQHAAALAARLQPVLTGTSPSATAAQSRPLSPAIAAAADLVAVLADYRLLDGSQLAELRTLPAQHPDPRALAKELVRRGWLTPWQVNQVFLRRAGELRLGPYLLLDRLGEGGMGTVYRAQHSVMRRLVALKAIRRDRLASLDSVRRFYREVRAVARLSHANIVLAHDAAEVDGTHFLVMEHVEGTDLARLVRAQGALPVARACEYVRQTAVGLQHAHEQGLVHRDVKPANLLLSKDGVIKVLDLGLARLQLAAGEQTVGELTAEGTVMGTPDYIAPEQAQESHTVDIRADVYSLGCTLYFLLTGQVPFPGGTLAQKLIRHQQANPAPVEKLRAEVPAALAAVLRKMMAKRPEERYQTPATVAAALLPFCQVGAVTGRTGVSPEEQARLAAVPVVVSRGTPAVEMDPTMTLAAPEGAPVSSGGVGAWLRRSPRRLVGVIGGGVLLAVLLSVLLRRGGGDGAADGPGGGARFPVVNWKEIPPPQGQADWLPKGLLYVLGNNGGRHWGPVRAVAFSPDGKLVASGGDDQSICVWKADTLEEFRLLRGHKGPIRSLAFTRDGRLLSGGEDRTVRLWDVQGGKQLFLLEGHTNPVVCLAVAPDGTHALSGDGLFANGSGLNFTVREWDLTAGKEVQRFTGHKRAVSSVAFTDERHALSASLDGTIRRWELGTGKEGPPLDFPPKGFPCTGPIALSTTGQWVGWTTAAAIPTWAKLEKAGALRALSLGEITTTNPVVSETVERIALANGPRLSVYGLPSATPQRSFDTSGTVLALSFSADGGRVVSGTDAGLVQVWDVASGQEVAPRLGHTFAVNVLAISKDGRHVLSGGADATVRLWNLEDKTVKTLSGHIAPVNFVGLFPVRDRAVSASGGGSVRFWDLAKAAAGEHTDIPGTVLGFFPQGNVAVADVGNVLAVFNAATGQELHRMPVSFVGAGRAEFTADGKWVVGIDSQGQVFIWNPRGDGKVRLCGPAAASVPSALRISPTGKLLLTGHVDGVVRLWDLEKQEKAQLRNFSGIVMRITAVAWAPDEKTVAASTSDGKVALWNASGGLPIARWQMPGAVNDVAFYPDGRHLLTANANGTVYVLRLKSFKGYKQGGN